MAKNTVFLFLRMLVVICVGLYTSRIVLNTLGVQDFGIYNVVGGIVVLFSFLQSALTNATYRFLAYDMGSGNTFSLGHTFSMSVNAHWILALLIFILCETVGLWFLNNELSFPKGRLEAANIAFQFSVLCFCTNPVYFTTNMFKSHRFFRNLPILSFFPSVSTVIAPFFMVYST